MARKFATELIGKTVMTQDGQILGMVNNFMLDTRSGRIHDMLVIPADEVETRLFRTDAQGRMILPFQGMKAVRDVVVMTAAPPGKA
jgi:sporulation protein YlmC with PRC-barrel domain